MSKNHSCLIPICPNQSNQGNGYFIMQSPRRFAILDMFLHAWRNIMIKLSVLMMKKLHINKGANQNET